MMAHRTTAADPSRALGQLRLGRPPSWALYLAMCILLGGASAGGALANWLLQVIAIMLLAREYCRPASDRPALPDIYRVALLAIAVIAVVQLIPLPSSWFPTPIGDVSDKLLATISVERSWAPLSETPINSVASLLSLLPAIAVAIKLLRPDAAPATLAPTLLCLAFVSVLLGLLQVGTGAESRFYLYAITNNDAPVGFFANRNHFATFSLMILPSTAFLLRRDIAHSKQQKIARLAGITLVAIATALVMLLNGSDAGLILFVPVLVASILLYRNDRLPPVVTGAALGLACFGLIAIMANAATLLAQIHPGSAPALDRATIWPRTVQLIGASLPFGTGLGSFRHAYANLEDPMTVTSIYVNHAHNDYLEIASELGVIGIAVIAVFLLWWGRRAIMIWHSADSLAKLGVILSGIVLMHSLGDYPARTAAISAVFAAAIALMVRHGRIEVPASGSSDNR